MKVFNKVTLNVKMLMAMALATICVSKVFAHVSETASHLTALTVEELRIDKAEKALPIIADILTIRYENFTQQINKAKLLSQLTEMALYHGNQLWQESVTSLVQTNNFDDRGLYWSRLKMTKSLRTLPLFGQLTLLQQEKLLWQFELASRGQQDVIFNHKTSKKILITGFDPFFLDKNIGQSNPSGVAAMQFDNLLIKVNGKQAEIQSLVFPVRFADFDQGMVEQLLSPYIADVDMIVTISMGRTEFDLERFPGLRRSALAPDNLNVLTGASSDNPLIPLLDNSPLIGPEFLEFSLPVIAMQKAKGIYKINDNHQVTTATKTFKPDSYAELTNETSVQGAGGGYLSNEISYRSILLRDKQRPSLPVGHIHTPRISAFQPEKIANIVEQIGEMLAQSLNAI